MRKLWEQRLITSKLCTQIQFPAMLARIFAWIIKRGYFTYSLAFFFKVFFLSDSYYLGLSKDFWVFWEQIDNLSKSRLDHTTECNSMMRTLKCCFDLFLNEQRNKVERWLMYWVGHWALGQRPLMMKWFLVFNTIMCPSHHPLPSDTRSAHSICHLPTPICSLWTQFWWLQFLLSVLCVFDLKFDDVWSMGQNEICCSHWNMAFKSVKPKLLSLVKLGSVFLQFVLLLCDCSCQCSQAWA